MTMSVYRVNSAYLRTSSVNNSNTHKTSPKNNVSFGKAKEGIIQLALKALERKPSNSAGEISLNPERKASINYHFGRRMFAGQKSNDGGKAQID